MIFLFTATTFGVILVSFVNMFMQSDMLKYLNSRNTNFKRTNILGVV